jgi:hypothetical protein
MKGGSNESTKYSRYHGSYTVLAGTRLYNRIQVATCQKIGMALPLDREFNFL